MNQRIAFAAMTVLLAAHMAVGTRSPEAAALAGTYVASAAVEGETYVLTLGEDASATLATVAGDPDRRRAASSGAWILEGSSVHVAFTGDSDAGGATGVTLEKRDGTLVAAPGDAAASRLAGLTFVRSEALPVPSRDN